jgi:elongator complex protein 5
MAPNNLSHRRTHNLLLISKLLSQRDHASPFTLLLDTLEQTAKPLVREYLRRAKLSKTASILLSFETFIPPPDVQQTIQCWDKTPLQISKAVQTATASAAAKGHTRCLLIVDSLASLTALSVKPSSSFNLTAFLSSLLQPAPPLSGAQAAVSVVAVYHTDIPLSTAATPYSPSPLSLLSYLATTIITLHSLPILLAAKAAEQRSLAAPLFGLAQEADGIIIGLKSLAKTLKPEHRGVVLELEHRRKSGRGVHEWYFLPSETPVKQAQPVSAQTFKESTILLDDHPLFQRAKDEVSEEDLSGMTFELGLTDRQRQEREGVVLPYFDAQKGGGGPGEGGRILYDMGVEDDFDEEEDEI